MLGGDANLYRIDEEFSSHSFLQVLRPMLPAAFGQLAGASQPRNSLYRLHLVTPRLYMLWVEHRRSPSRRVGKWLLKVCSS